MSKYANSAFELISKSTALKSIQKDALVAFVKDGHGRMYSDGNYLAHRGERSHALHVVLSGSVMVEAKESEGKGHEMGAGEVAGDLRAFTEEPRWADIYAIDSVMALEVDASTLRPTFAEHPEFFMALVQSLSKFSENTDDIISATVQAALEQQSVDQAEHHREGLDPAKALEIAARWQKLKEEARAADDRAREAARKAVDGQIGRR
ncbi:MAG TPA: cyclic nucleotide-binding domain-containing protein [Chloroflexota bacterium]|nr:cyclic nucleotide-binding domain-containing protein [Chloroflexota bacterium]